jgi:hypothetical protein
MSKSIRNCGSTSDGRNTFFLCGVRPKGLATNGLHEPYELRGSCTDLWGAGGETPPAYPVSRRLCKDCGDNVGKVNTHVSMAGAGGNRDTEGVYASQCLSLQ